MGCCQTTPSTPCKKKKSLLLKLLRGWKSVPELLHLDITGVLVHLCVWGTARHGMAGFPPEFPGFYILMFKYDLSRPV